MYAAATACSNGVTPLGVHHAPDVGRSGLLQQLDGPAEVAVGQLAVPVHPHHDVVPGGPEPQVEGVRRPGLGLSTTRTRASVAASSAAISSVRSLLGPTARITSSSPG